MATRGCGGDEWRHFDKARCHASYDAPRGADSQNTVVQHVSRPERHTHASPQLERMGEVIGSNTSMGATGAEGGISVRGVVGTIVGVTITGGDRTQARQEQLGGGVGWDSTNLAVLVGARPFRGAASRVYITERGCVRSAMDGYARGAVKCSPSQIYTTKDFVRQIWHPPNRR